MQDEDCDESAMQNVKHLGFSVNFALLFTFLKTPSTDDRGKAVEDFIVKTTNGVMNQWELH